MRKLANIARRVFGNSVQASYFKVFVGQFWIFGHYRPQSMLFRVLLPSCSMVCSVQKFKIGQWKRSKCILWKYIICIAECEIKGQGLHLVVFPENPLHEVFFILINEQVGVKRNTVGSHRNADCLLKYTFTKHSCWFHRELQLPST